MESTPGTVTKVKGKPNTRGHVWDPACLLPSVCKETGCRPDPRHKTGETLILCLSLTWPWAACMSDGGVGLCGGDWGELRNDYCSCEEKCPFASELSICSSSYDTQAAWTEMRTMEGKRAVIWSHEGWSRGIHNADSLLRKWGRRWSLCWELKSKPGWKEQRGEKGKGLRGKMVCDCSWSLLLNKKEEEDGSQRKAPSLQRPWNCKLKHHIAYSYWNLSSSFMERKERA